MIGFPYGTTMNRKKQSADGRRFRRLGHDADEVEKDRMNRIDGRIRCSAGLAILA
jgi:hypothetical protein